MRNNIKHISKLKDIIKLISSLEKYLSPSITDKNIDIYEYCVKIFNKGYVVGCVEPEPCAIVAGYCNNLKDRIGYISVVIVSPEYRERGLAKELITRFEDTAMTYGMDKVKVEVYDKNEIAMQLYEKLGYTFLEKAGEDSFYMLKAL